MKPPARPSEKLARWAAAALWFAVILSLSQEPFGSSHTEGWLTQFFASWGIDVGQFAGILNLIVRKCAHFVECSRTGATPINNARMATRIVASLAASERSIDLGGDAVPIGGQSVELCEEPVVAGATI